VGGPRNLFQIDTLSRHSWRLSLSAIRWRTSVARIHTGDMPPNGFRYDSPEKECT